MRHPGFQSPLLVLDNPFPMERPENLEEATSLERNKAFGVDLDLDLLGIEIDEKTLVPRPANASSHARSLAASTTLSLNHYIELALKVPVTAAKGSSKKSLATTPIPPILYLKEPSIFTVTIPSEPAHLHLTTYLMTKQAPSVSVAALSFEDPSIFLRPNMIDDGIKGKLFDYRGSIGSSKIDSNPVHLNIEVTHNSVVLKQMKKPIP
ncbi:hypothetical protein GIB67_003671 [Kingdonia uniflora]|uniref:Uncharacterized protein n=1 Tax=Kingdonia uniflora TaxID=39325 RepID=A0A7J7M3R6_9MAGN|nr:hypothetical protein GIB67_003671 [Kingdonia uniflora]